jgi:uncharacterized protein (DUF433 family)
LNRQESGDYNAGMTSLVIHSDPRIQSATPVFVGTRVPVKNLVDYLEAGDFPRAVSRRFPFRIPQAGSRGA